MENCRYMVSLAARENVEVEIFSLRRDLRSIRIAGNEILEAQNIVEEGYGTRVVRDGSKGFAVTNRSSRDSLEKSFRAALSMAKKSARAPGWCGFPEKVNQNKERYPQWLCDKGLASMHTEETVRLALRMIKEASSDGNAKHSLAGVLILLLEEFSILNSQGLEHLAEPSSTIYSQIIVETRKGDRYSTSTSQFCSRRCADFNPEQEVNKAIAYTSELDALPRTTINKGKYDVILSPEATGAFTSYLVSPMITGRSVQSGASCLRGKLNTRIATDSYSLIDDGGMEGGIASATVDDEGTPTQCTNVVEKGILRRHLHDISSAVSCETSTTGNARRTSDTIGRTYLTPPEPSPTNLITVTGDYSFEELIEETKTGVVVNSLGYTFHLVPERGYFNIISGVPLMIVENGRIKAYTENVAVSGELVNTLMSIDAVGKGACNSLYIGSIAALSPCLRIRGMAVGRTV